MTPPPEQFGEWMAEAVKRNPGSPGLIASYVADQAYAAGADAELEHCCSLLARRCEGGLNLYSDIGDWLYSARRPAPPSPQQQALDACAGALAAGRLSPDEAALIRVALEQNS